MFIEQLKKIKQKNFEDFEISKKRFEMEDIKFVSKVIAIENLIDFESDIIVDILEDFFDNEAINTVIGVKFDRNRVVTVLRDIYFIAFLVQSNLANRTINLNVLSNGALKVRIYFSILDYQKWLSN